MSFPKYPTYKESGVAWLEKIPERWSAGPLKRVISKVESGTSVNSIDTPAENGDLGVLKTSCVYGGSFNENENKRVVEEEHHRVTCPLRSNALIVSRMNTPELVGAAGLVAHARDGLYLPDRLWQIAFDGAIPAFAYYWTLTVYYRAQVQAACTGTSASMQNLSQPQFCSFIFPCPTLPEQSAIAAFLDRETAKIDALVAEQEKLIELLKEKRQAVISHAVTKGLDPNVPMKDSGVEWLGEVPEHWKSLPLAAASWVRARLGWKGLKAEEYVDDGFILLATPNIKGEMIDFENVNYISQHRYDESPEISLSIGDVLLAKDGSTLGIVNIVRELPRPATVNSSIAVITPNKKLNPLFLFYFFHSSFVEATIQRLKGGMGVPHLFQSDLNKIKIPLPSYSEQRVITTFLDRETAKIDALITESQHAITLLKERRSALISAAVTGKIDVRGLTDATQ